MSLLVLTPMEERVMYALAYATRSLATADDWMIISSGRNYLYGNEWGGAQRGSSFPLICRFLGSLRSKGLVERLESQSALNEGRSWGEWRLTKSGYDLLGLPVGGYLI